MKPTVAVLLAWLIPGAGHWYLGLRQKAVFYAVAITALFVIGGLLTDFRHVNPDRHEFYFWAFLLNGGETLGAWLATRHLPIEDAMFRVHLACLYTGVAGLLNLLVMIDALLFGAGWLARDVDETGTATAEGAA